ncbi:MAG: phospholipid/cholesterol/gamma-HCH transport system substrate-binding protein, partial [Pseudonocardiales bacterium]|nr:phospholipid/cholesterol/gamma-HCH transport system substrate-binding protein [Pseudonocardiales bacterium]
SWFQFYLCGATGSVGLEPYLPPAEIPAFTSASPRCGPDPSGVQGQNPKALGGIPPVAPGGSGPPGLPPALSLPGGH